MGTTTIFTRHNDFGLGFTLKEYEWTLFKKMILFDIERLDRNFKKRLRRKKP